MKTLKYISAAALALILLNAIAFNNVSTLNSSSKVKFVANLASSTSVATDVKQLGSEINNGKSSSFPIYVSEINHGLFYYTDINNSNSTLLSRNFLFSKFDSNTSTWSKPINLEKDFSSFQEINKNMNFQEIFITIDNDIYSVDLKKSTFSPHKLNINTKYVECSPSLSPDGNTLYFISNRPGGFGGKDVWSSERLSNGNWSEPVNLGSKVNTAEDEESPFMMADGATLYFSSKGHSSMGGFDIFSATLSDDGFWSKPESLGTPVNTVGDDFYYITDTYGKCAFYSSDKGQQGKQSIYCVNYQK
jgi:Tol biopolymer transport system component